MVNKKNVEEVASIVQRKEKILLTLITLDYVQMALLLFFANCITKTKLLQMICNLHDCLHPQAHFPCKGDQASFSKNTFLATTKTFSSSLYSGRPIASPVGVFFLLVSYTTIFSVLLSLKVSS